MSSTEPDEEESIFDEVVTAQTNSEREALLDLRCGSNTVLRCRIESLLTAYAISEYLESRPAELLNLSPLAPSLVGSRIGAFDILELIGQGGMGDVYLARSVNEPRSFVAMKVIKAGMDTRQVISRFNLERSILQMLDHPNIARFVDSGIAGCGRAYVAMEWVQGIPITDYCDRQRLSIDDRLRLFLDVCSAVDHAHGLGVVHRDLKPQNVLVKHCDGKAVAKVIDFGIAKALTEDSGIGSRLTGAIQCLGTPLYISPEQMNWSSDIDKRTDVYSLGVVLYELLTGTTPLQLDGMSELDLQGLKNQQLSEELDLPSQRVTSLSAELGKEISEARVTEKQQLIRRLRGELDWITAKAMEKDRGRRYAGPAEFAADIRACLEHRPISAHAPTMASRWRKWSKRNVRTVSLITRIGVVACTIGLVLGFGRVIHVAREESKLAQSEQVHTQFVRDIQMATDLLRSGDSNSAKTLLNKYSSQSGNSYANHFATGYLRGLIPDPIQSFVGHQHEILDMDLSKDGRWIASGDRGGDILIWDRQSGREVRRLHPSDKEVTRVRFSPAENLLATAGQDCIVRLWKIEDWSLVGELVHHERTINGLAWSPDGLHLASGDRGGNVCIWVEQTRTLERIIRQHAEAVRCLEWSPDGVRLAIADGNQGVRVWNTESWTESEFIDNHGNGTLAIAFSADSQRMAFGGYGSELVVVELGTQAEVSRIKTHDQIWSLTFGDSREIIVGEGTGHLEVFNYEWKTKTWQSIRVWDSSATSSSFRSVAFSDAAGSKELIVVSDIDRMIEVIPASSVTGNEASEQDAFQMGPITPLNHRVCASEDRTAFIGSPSDATKTKTLPVIVNAPCSPAYCASRNYVAIAGENGDAYVFRADTWQMVSRLEFPKTIWTMSFSRDGNSLSLGGAEGAIRIWDLEKLTYRDLSRYASKSPAMAVYSPSSDLLSIGCALSRNLTCLNSHSLMEIRTVELLPWRRLYFHPRGDFIMVCHEGSFSVWKDDLSEKLWVGVASEADEVMSVSITPDQQVLAILLHRGTVELWDLRSRSRLCTTSALLSDTYNQWVAFPDSTTLWVGSERDKTLFSFRSKR